jgi:hypothetical protein
MHARPPKKYQRNSLVNSSGYRQILPDPSHRNSDRLKIHTPPRAAIAGASAPEKTGSDAKKPPGNGAASSFGRIVPTEAKPSELSGCILSLAQTGVKAKTLQMQLIENRLFIDQYPNGNIRFLFACKDSRRSQMATNE